MKSIKRGSPARRRARKAKRPGSTTAAEPSPTPSSKPELEDGDTEVVPPDAGAAEAQDERDTDRTAGEGMSGGIERPDKLESMN